MEDDGLREIHYKDDNTGEDYTIFIKDINETEQSSRQFNVGLFNKLIVQYRLEIAAICIGDIATIITNGKTEHTPESLIGAWDLINSRCQVLHDEGYISENLEWSDHDVPECESVTKYLEDYEGGVAIIGIDDEGHANYFFHGSPYGGYAWMDTYINELRKNLFIRLKGTDNG